MAHVDRVVFDETKPESKVTDGVYVAERIVRTERDVYRKDGTFCFTRKLENRTYIIVDTRNNKRSVPYQNYHAAHSDHWSVIAGTYKRGMQDDPT